MQMLHRGFLEDGETSEETSKGGGRGGVRAAGIRTR